MSQAVDLVNKTGVSDKMTEIQMVQLGKHLQKSWALVFVPKPCKFGFKIGKRFNRRVP